MTIAVCCVSPEGIVMGADSTTSIMMPQGGFHYLNHNQKIFEVGKNSKLCVVTWGLAALGHLSHRTQIAQFADALAASPATSVLDACERWTSHFWQNYQQIGAGEIALVKSLAMKLPHDPACPDLVNARTAEEEKTFQQLKFGLVVGFTMGGYHPSDRLPHAYEIIFDPLGTKPTPANIVMGDTRCWGAPKVFGRIVAGIDPEVRAAILASPKWSGTEADLDALLISHQLYLPSLPMRDAIDFVHSCISSTIKTMKFSTLSQTCGGPIEVAAITSDRDFRWVRHKEWDVAINEGYAPWKI